MIGDHGDVAFAPFVDDHLGSAVSFDAMFKFLHTRFFPGCVSDLSRFKTSPEALNWFRLQANERTDQDEQEVYARLPAWKTLLGQLSDSRIEQIINEIGGPGFWLS